MDINKPRFELISKYSDGSAEKPKIVPINDMPWDTKTDRRGFLGAGLVAAAVLALLSQCKKSDQEVSESQYLLADCYNLLFTAMGPDNKILVSVSEGDIKLWSMPDETLLKTLFGSCQLTAFNPTGNILATATGATIKLWSLPDGTLLKTLQGHTRDIYSLCISSNVLVSTAYDGTIKLWSFPNGTLLKTLQGEIYAVIAITPNGSILVSASIDKLIKLWSLPDGTLLRTLPGHSKPAHAIAISPNGNMLVSTCDDGTIKLWSLPDGTLLKTLQGNTDYLTRIAISPNGNILVSTSANNSTTKIWSLPDGTLLKTFQDSGYCTFIPNGNILIYSSSSPSLIEVWSLPQLTLLKSFENPGRIVISPDGKTLYGSAGQSIRVWDFEKNEFIGFLFDPACNKTTYKAVKYNVRNTIIGGIVTYTTYTLPCGASIPSGAVCTCNCVSGTIQPPPTGGGGGGGGGSYCVCNLVCTCVPVCQAHRLLHPDKFVRKLAREILFFMGMNELEYMTWAANNSSLKLKTAIESLINEIKKGVKSNYKNWPSIQKCVGYINNNDEVISIMAAQMINLKSNLNNQVISQDLHHQMESLLIRSKEIHWEKMLRI